MGECLLLAQARSQLVTSGDGRTAVHQCADLTCHRFNRLCAWSFNAIRTNTGHMFAARPSPLKACHVTSGDCRTTVHPCAFFTCHRFNNLRALSCNATRTNTGANVCCSHKPDHSLSHLATDAGHQFNCLRALSFNAFRTSTGGANVCCSHKPDHSLSHLATVAGQRFKRLRVLSFNAIRASTGANVCCSHKPDPSLSHLATVACHRFNCLLSLGFDVIRTNTAVGAVLQGAQRHD